MKRYLIISGDDLGLSKGTDEGILKAHQKGVLTSTSIMPNMPSFNDGVKLAKANPNLGIGMHLCLTWGKPVLPATKVPDLVDKQGYFNPSYAGLLIKSLNKNILKQIEAELSAQAQKIASYIKPDHINSQQHIHMIPTIYPLFETLTKKFNIKFLRLTKEKFFLIPKAPYIYNPFINKNIIKWLLMNTFSLNKKPKKAVRFYGLMYTLKTDINILRYLLPNLPGGINDVLTHPALFNLSKIDTKELDYDKQFITPFMKDPGRKIELETLLDPEIKDIIKKEKFILTNYRDLSKI